MYALWHHLAMTQTPPGAVDENGQPVIHKLVRSLDLGDKTQSLDGHRLTFIHLPKCAGRSFSAVLDKWFLNAVGDPKFGCYATGTIYGQPLGGGKGEATDALASAHPALRFLRGHIPFGSDDRFDLSPVTVTFLRDPMARSLSHFAFGADRGGWSLDTPFATVVERGGILDNPMTRQLAGLTSPEEPCNEATLKTAQTNLARCAFVGLAEQFDLSLQIFLSRFGLPSVIYVDRGRGKSLDLPAQLSSQVEPFINFDRLLYAGVSLDPVDGQTRLDLWVDNAVITVEPAPGQPIPISGVDQIRQVLASRQFEFQDPLV